MNHLATPRFWTCYHALPEDVRLIADKAFALLKENPHHLSLHFKPLGNVFSVRVGLRYRALATRDRDNFIWFWIGTHAEYDRLIS